MKNQILVLVLFLVSLTVSAQDGAYQNAMGAAMGSFAEAKTADDFHAAANTFTRIADGSEGEYLPDYYASLSLIIQSFYMKDAAQRDEIVDQALAHIEKAEAISPKNDELEVMRGFAFTAKMVVDPATRGQRYGALIAQHYGKAMQMDPSNPRAVALMARNQLGTAQFFGTEPTQACALAKQSMDLFEKEEKAGAKGFEPTWGKDNAMEVLAACK